MPLPFLAPIIGGLIGGIGSVAGAAIGGSATASATREANQVNMEEAQRNRDFQAMMSNSAHQRQVEDMKAAGLNPVLSANGGASAPSGSMATANPVNHSYVGDAVARALSSAKDIMTFEKDMEQRDAQIAATKAGAVAAAAQADNAAASAQATKAEIPTIVAKSKYAGAEADLRKAQAEIDKSAVKYDSVMTRIFDVLGVASNAVNIRRMLLGTVNQQRNQTIREESHLRRQGMRGTSLP